MTFCRPLKNCYFFEFAEATFTGFDSQVESARNHNEKHNRREVKIREMNVNSNMDGALKAHFSGDDFVLELFKRNVICALLHLMFCIIFFALGAWEMGVYNIISPVYFMLIAWLLWSGKTKNTGLVDNLDSGEFILHSVLAVCFTGFSLGFQYILFTLAIPIVVLTDDRSNLRYNSIRTIISVGLYVVLQVCVQYNIIVPKYEFSNTDSIILTSLLVMVVFLLLNSQIIANFRNFEGHMKEYRQKELEAAQKINEMNMHVIRNIAGVIEERDESTGEHTERTTVYVGEICKELVREGKFKDELTEDNINIITQTAALHDIGKIRTSDTILNKPGKLTTEEFEIMKKHTTDGGKIIHNVFAHVEDKRYEQTAFEIAKYHHEKWNGTGYPEGKKGDEIPLSARIVAVSDVYDALVSERVYKPAYSEEEAIRIIEGDTGSHFDPDVAAAFMKVRKTAE